jgi:hypothetical protein
MQKIEWELIDMSNDIHWVFILIWIIANFILIAKYISIKSENYELASERDIWKEQSNYLAKKLNEEKVNSYTRAEFAKRQSEAQKTQSDLVRIVREYVKDFQ